MNIRIPLTALALVMAVSAPVIAQDIDGGMITCAEYEAMDAAGKNAAMGAVRVFARESVNASAAGTVAQMVNATDEVFMGRMDQSCVSAEDKTTTVLAAMQTTN